MSVWKSIDSVIRNTFLITVGNWNLLEVFKTSKLLSPAHGTHYETCSINPYFGGYRVLCCIWLLGIISRLDDNILALERVFRFALISLRRYISERCKTWPYWFLYKCIKLIHHNITLMPFRVFYEFKSKLWRRTNISFPPSVQSIRTYVTGPYSVFKSVFKRC